MKKVSSSHKKSKDRKHRKTLRGTDGYSSGGDRLSQQSAFPVSTPDRLGPLSDLLEEEIVLPGESRDTSASTDGRGGAKDKADAQGAAKMKGGHGNWAYLPPPRSPTTSTTSSETSLVKP